MTLFSHGPNGGIDVCWHLAPYLPFDTFSSTTKIEKLFFLFSCQLDSFRFFFLFVEGTSVI